jgi:hypothetical protein
MFARTQIKQWQSEADQHQRSVDNVNRVLLASEILTTVAVIAATSAVTMGFASYFSSTAMASRFGAWVAGFADTTASTATVTVANYTRTAQALQMIARIASASTASSSAATGLTATEMTAAFAGAGSRVVAGVSVSLALSSFNRAVQGRPFNQNYFLTDLLPSILLAVLIGIVGSPGPKTDVQTRLARRLSERLPDWRHLTTYRPSNQALAIVFGKGGMKLFKSITGPVRLADIDASLRAQGSSLEAAIRHTTTKIAEEVHMLALQAMVDTERSIRAAAIKQSYKGQVGNVARFGHWLFREKLSGDAPIEERLKLQNTELAVALAGRDLWTAVDRVYQDLEVISKMPPSRY